jgi:uncharacterized RDD family membrane protein YckC
MQSDVNTMGNDPRAQSQITNDTQFGGFWRRFAAVVVDFFAMLIPILLVSTLLRASIFFVTDIDLDVLNFIESIVTMCMWWLYYSLFDSSSWQATLGKRALRLKVVDLDGKRISFARASGRFFAKYLSALTFCIGYMLAGWTKRKRSLHDMIAKTYVIRAEV